MTWPSKKGNMVVVRVNGSGKTTMSKVLTGAYLASSGSVSYDGQDMKALKRNSLYRHISLVTQDFVQTTSPCGKILASAI